MVTFAESTVVPPESVVSDARAVPLPTAAEKVVTFEELTVRAWPPLTAPVKVALPLPVEIVVLAARVVVSAAVNRLLVVV